MTTHKLLTIAIPTFNRADSLRLLLDTLVVELAGLEGLVDLIIADNASVDQTQDVTSAFQATFPTAIVLRHVQNLGAEENFCRCIDLMCTKYFWIIGDDDLPKAGVVRQVLALLGRESPDLVYLRSEWTKQIMGASQGIPVKQLGYKTLNKLNFARRVNVWTTFISGMVVNRETFLRSNDKTPTRRFAGTSLIQLGWVFENLRNGRKFIFVTDPCVLATAENSGGYAVITVFGENFTRIVNEVFGNGSPMATAIIRRTILNHISQLIWKARFRKASNFEKEIIWNCLRGQLSGWLGFWLLLAPINFLPRHISLVFVLISIGVGKLISAKDLVNEYFNVFNDESHRFINP